jgi:hypothetical protein
LGLSRFCRRRPPFLQPLIPPDVDQAWKLYTTNPLANRIISIRTEFIVDSKSAPEAANRHVQQVLDDFWYDPVNDMPNFIIQATRQLLIFGSRSSLSSSTCPATTLPSR